MGPIKITPAMPMLCRQLQPRYLSRLLAWTDISEVLVVHPSLPISPREAAPFTTHIQQPEVPTFSRNTKIAECIWNLAETEGYRPNCPF